MRKYKFSISVEDKNGDTKKVFECLLSQQEHSRQSHSRSSEKKHAKPKYSYKIALDESGGIYKKLFLEIYNGKFKADLLSLSGEKVPIKRSVSIAEQDPIENLKNFGDNYAQKLYGINCALERQPQNRRGNRIEYMREGASYQRRCVHA